MGLAVGSAVSVFADGLVTNSFNFGGLALDFFTVVDDRLCDRLDFSKRPGPLRVLVSSVLEYPYCMELCRLPPASALPAEETTEFWAEAAADAERRVIICNGGFSEPAVN